MNELAEKEAKAIAEELRSMARTVNKLLDAVMKDGDTTDAGFIATVGIAVAMVGMQVSGLSKRAHTMVGMLQAEEELARSAVAEKWEARVKADAD